MNFYIIFLKINLQTIQNINYWLNSNSLHVHLNCNAPERVTTWGDLINRIFDVNFSRWLCDNIFCLLFRKLGAPHSVANKIEIKIFKTILHH